MRYSKKRVRNRYWHRVLVPRLLPPPIFWPFSTGLLCRLILFGNSTRSLHETWQVWNCIIELNWTFYWQSQIVVTSLWTHLFTYWGTIKKNCRLRQGRESFWQEIFSTISAFCWLASILPVSRFPISPVFRDLKAAFSGFRPSIFSSFPALFEHTCAYSPGIRERS